MSQAVVYLLSISNGKKEEEMAGAEVVEECKLGEILGSRYISLFKREYMLIDHSICR